MMHSTVFLEAFGRFLTGGYSDADEEDLYSVFRARAELMGWDVPPRRPPTRRPGLWGMNEAELATESEAPRIGTAQVGLEAGVPLATTLPALIDNLDNSLRYFGEVELSGYRITAVYLEPGQVDHAGDLVSMLNWFGPPSRSSKVLVYGAPDAGPDIVSRLQRRNTGLFRFDAVETGAGWDTSLEWTELRIAPTPDVGLKVALPDGPSAAGWVLASVTNMALTLVPNLTELRMSLEYSQATESG